MLDIREARPEDQRGWLGLRTLQWPNGSVEAHERAIARIFEHPEQKCFVALQYGEVIGFLEVEVNSLNVRTSDNPVGLIRNGYIDENHRNRLIGKHLLQEAEVWCKSLGCGEMFSEVDSSDEESIGSHHGMGFKEAQEFTLLSKTVD